MERGRCHRVTSESFSPKLSIVCLGMIVRRFGLRQRDGQCYEFGKHGAEAYGDPAITGQIGDMRHWFLVLICTNACGTLGALASASRALRRTK